MSLALSVSILLAGVLLVYLAMWRGWRQRSSRQADVPPLLPVEETAGNAPVLLESSGRYYATTTAGQWMDRVLAHGLGVRGPCTLRLNPDGLDVLRGDMSFRIPRADLEGARHDRGIAGKVVPPAGVLVVTWRHPRAEPTDPSRHPGDRPAPPPSPQYTFDSGFRLAHADDHEAWVTAVTSMTSEARR